MRAAGMDPTVACVRQDMPVEELLGRFLATGIHAAPVVDGDGRLVGFVSLRDLRAHAGTVADVMTTSAARLFDVMRWLGQQGRA
jgi:CBS domain-containing protein